MIELETLVLQFLERREITPSLTPEAFAETFSEEAPERREEILEAARSALAIERLLPSAEDRRPEIIGGYTVLEEIGRGGMGIVYRVEKEGEPFALKVLPAASLMGTRVLDRFRREAETLARLSDPGIVRIHTAGVDGELPYIVMDLVQGTPLHLLTSVLSLTDAAVLVEQIGRTIHTVHEQGVVHRDLKPQNVLVLGSGQPVLVDFGLSLATDLATLTGTGDILGTPRYMAPEQMLGGETDRRTDVHALGLILFELVTGRPARGGSTQAAILDPVPSPRSVRADLPRPVDRILRTALARNPDRRYATSLAMAEDLRRFLDGNPVEARPPGRLVQAAEWCRSSMHAVVSATRRPRDETAPVDSATSRQRETSLDDAVTAWLDGDTDRALRKVAEVRRLEPQNATASLLTTHIRGHRGSFSGTSMDRMVEGLRLLDGARHREALERFDDPSLEELHPPLAAALIGLSAAQIGQLGLAERELSAAARRLTRCLRIHRALGSVYTRLSRLSEAEQAFLHASSRAPEAPAVWRDLASVYEKEGNIELGLEAVRRAREFGGTLEGKLEGKLDGESAGKLAAEDDAETQRIQASLKDQAGERAEARAILEQLVARDPEDYASYHLLGLSWDRDHRIVEAMGFYGGALEIRPSHTASLINLAYLHSGALRGRCQRCDRAYAANPECLDLERAERYLLRALEEDRGSSASLTRTAVDIALRLENRTRIAALLEELIRSAPRTPGILQLEHTLRVLRIAEPEGNPDIP